MPSLKYRVKAGGLVAKMSSETGEGYLYRGDLVPAGVPADEVERLLDLGLIEESEPVEVVLVVAEADRPAAPVDPVGSPLVEDAPAARSPRAKSV